MRQPVKKRLAKVVTLTPPVNGMVLDRPLQAGEVGNAELVENFLPTTRGLKIRGGVIKAADVTDPALSMWSYNAAGAGAFFAATATGLYECSTFDPDTPEVPLYSSLTSGYFSAAQIGTSGGEFQIAVNGTDFAFLHDGTDLQPLTSVTVNDLAYDALVTEFAVGETVTGGTSGASATILAIAHNGTAGTLKIGTITSGPFQDDEGLTSAGGEAVADGASSEASTTAITGVDTSDLSHVWKFKSRLFFVEKNTMTVWYLPVDSIGGTANDFSLSGTFQRGGSIKFGATWSTDAGDGMDDMCVIVSDQGEVALYQGTDPSNASTWALIGRYDISPPLGKNAHVSAGGDLLVATTDGIIPMSQVRVKDPAAVAFAAVTRGIRPIWAVEAARNTDNVILEKWSANNLLMVCLPNSTRMLTANLQTGAWAQQMAGWAGSCVALHDGNAYLGKADGFIRQLDVTGLDDDEAFVARYAHSPVDFGNAASYKVAQLVRYSFFSTFSFSYKAEIGTDYNVEFGSAPGYAVIDFDVLIWDNGQNWDSGALWGSDSESSEAVLTTEWRAVSGAGYALAPMLQITSAVGAKLDIELVGIDMTYEEGGVVV